jgi:hypothetical protein
MRRRSNKARQARKVDLKSQVMVRRMARPNHQPRLGQLRHLSLQGYQAITSTGGRQEEIHKQSFFLRSWTLPATEMHGMLLN